MPDLHLDLLPQRNRDETLLHVRDLLHAPKDAAGFGYCRA